MLTIYHNPRCSKSRQALALLEAQGIEPEIIQYLKTPPTQAQLQALVKALKLQPRDLLRSKEPEYKTLGLHDPALKDEEIIAAIAQHPKLLERPIVVKGKKAVIGRPPENVLTLLEGAK